MRKLVVITDMDFRSSGYYNIAIQSLSRLAGMDYEIKVCGLSYKGEEHNYPFSILPANNIMDAKSEAINLDFVWHPDLILVMMDIPLQNFFYQNLPMYQKKYVALTPMENGPLTMSWAAMLIGMRAVLFISELGRDEARKAGLLNADYIQIGIDTNEWRRPTPDERTQIRKGLNFDEDAFIVLTVADNQERKNLWGAIAAIQKLKQMTDRKIRHIIVTREESEVGWKLRDLAQSMDLVQELVIYRRGMPRKELWSLYTISDAFLLTSKAEGLGMPILEAMSVGTPVVATDTGAIHELLSESRGHLIPPEYSFIDVWGNSKRDMIDIEKAALVLRDIMENGSVTVEPARGYAESRTWDGMVAKLRETLEKAINEQTQT